MILIKNIGQLLTNQGDPIQQAALIIKGEKIFWCGEESALPQVAIDETIDAGGSLVMPGLIDCHSHAVFAGSRAHDFGLRMMGKSYQQIMAQGGGINSTVESLREINIDDLHAQSRERIGKIFARGVTTLEIKSGYGLDLESELKMLQVIKDVNGRAAIDLHATFLGAHIVPREYAAERTGYIDLLIEEMLPAVREGNLAQDCDVFCEEGAFTVDESRAILAKALELGFGLRAHVQQLARSGGISLLEHLPIKSFSHADFISDADIDLLAKHRTIVEALPIAALFLRSKNITPVRQLIDRGVSLSIATDFNPGSAMCDDLVLAARLGVTYMGFSCDEAVKAITVNAAKALGLNDRGQIKKGQLADLLICRVNNVAEFFYDWTSNPVAKVIKRGRVQ